MTATAPARPANVRTVGDRIEGLLDDLRASADSRTQEQVEDVVRLVMELYGAALERALDIVYDDGRGEAAIERLGDDDLVSGVLVLHDLHPLPVGVRVQRALDRVRPYLGSHGGGVTVEAIEGEVARIRMEGSCDGCPSSSITITYAIEKAILGAAPEIARVDVIEPTAGAGGHGHDHDQPAPVGPGQLIQLGPRRSSGADSVGAALADRPGPGVGEAGHNGRPASANRGRAGDAAAEWITPDRADRPAAGEVVSLRLGGTQILLCGTVDQTYAYRDRCPGCTASLAAARLEGDDLACPSCGRQFDVRHAGRSRGSGTTHLEPLPLLSEGGAFRIAVPVGA